MSDELIVGLTFLAPSLALFIWTQVRKPNRRHDWTAERHRTISRNGFKSRQGIR
jgi:hypothetical protein